MKPRYFYYFYSKNDQDSPLDLRMKLEHMDQPDLWSARQMHASGWPSAKNSSWKSSQEQLKESVLAQVQLKYNSQLPVTTII